MNKIKIASVLTLTSLLLVTSFSSALAENNSVAAKVNETVITQDQVNAHFAELAKQGGAASVSKKAALEDLIKRVAAVQEAKKLKLDQDIAVTERMDNVLISALLEKKLNAEFDKVNLSESEAKTWYEKNPEIRTSHIFIAVPPAASAEEEQKAADKASERLSQLAKEIKSGKLTFAEAAQRNSEDPSASIGGDLDYRTKDRLDPVFYKAAVKLGKPGEISSPVKTSYGVHLIRLTAKHSWIEVDRTRVKRLIMDEKRQMISDRYLNDLRQKAKVSTN